MRRLFILAAALFAASFAAFFAAGCAKPPGSTSNAPMGAPAGILGIARPAYDKTRAEWQAGVLPPGAVTFDKTKDYFATLHTTLGDITLKFYPDVAPRHVAAFVNLAEIGYYDGAVFHRVIPGFMMQGGDPTGTGRGGPGYVLKNEFNSRRHVKGILSAARTADPDSAGSQFFICFANAASLDNQYTVFGEVVSGIEVVDAFEKIGTQSGKPLREERIKTVDVAVKDR